MSRLSVLYRAMETLRREGLSWSEDQEKQLSNLEEEIIRDEILPALSNQVAPILNQIERKLTLVIDYEPGQEASVRMTRKAVVINDNESKIFRLVPYDKQEPQKQNNVTKTPDPASQLTVKFPDGTVIREFHSNRTFAATIEKIGLERVMRGRFKLVGSLIVTQKSPNKPGVLQSGKYYIYTSASNKEKIKALKKISDVLNLGLTLEIGMKPIKGERHSIETTPITTYPDFSHKGQQKSNDKCHTLQFGFEQYIDKLQVTEGTKRNYRRSITDAVVQDRLLSVASNKSIFEVTNPALIERTMRLIGTEYRHGYPHAMLRHYCEYLRRNRQTSSDISIDFDIPNESNIKRKREGGSLKYSTQMGIVEIANKYRTIGEVPTMVMRHKVDWSFLTNGINVPVDRQPVLLANLGYDFLRGDSRVVTFVVGDEAFKVRFGNFNQKNHPASDVIQFRFAESAFTKRMQERMPELFNWLTDAKEAAGSTRVHVQEPATMTRYFTLYKLSREDVFLIEFDPIY